MLGGAKRYTSPKKVFSILTGSAEKASKKNSPGGCRGSFEEALRLFSEKQ